MKKQKLQVSKTTVEKRSISATPELFTQADTMAKRKMMTNFSEYIRSLISRDLRGELESAHSGAK